MRATIFAFGAAVLLVLGGGCREDDAGGAMPANTPFDGSRTERKVYLAAYRDAYLRAAHGDLSPGYCWQFDRPRMEGASYGRDAGRDAYHRLALEAETGVPLPTRTPFDHNEGQRQDYLYTFREAYRRSVTGDCSLYFSYDSPRLQGSRAGQDLGSDVYLRSGGTYRLEYLPLTKSRSVASPFRSFVTDFTNRLPESVNALWRVTALPSETTNRISCIVEYQLCGNSNLFVKEYSYVQTSRRDWKLVWNANPSE